MTPQRISYIVVMSGIVVLAFLLLWGCVTQQVNVNSTIDDCATAEEPALIVKGDCEGKGHRTTLPAEPEGVE